MNEVLISTNENEILVSTNENEVLISTNENEILVSTNLNEVLLRESAILSHFSGIWGKIPTYPWTLAFLGNTTRYMRSSGRLGRVI